MIRNRKLVVSMLFISIFFMLVLAVKYVDGETDSSNKKTILIDAGHGGVDGGAVSRNGTIEKDITLNIALMLKDKLQQEGFKVIMTRETDCGLYTEDGSIRKKKLEDLENRCKLKADSQCDVFVSIHLNMYEISKYYGAQVWYSEYKSEQRTSERLAHLMQQNLILDLNNGNHRKAKPALHYYKLLRCNDNMPSVIVECGFLSNNNEENLLKTEEYQEKIAKSLCKSIIEYYK